MAVDPRIVALQKMLSNNGDDTQDGMPPDTIMQQIVQLMAQKGVDANQAVPLMRDSAPRPPRGQPVEDFLKIPENRALLPRVGDEPIPQIDVQTSRQAPTKGPNLPTSSSAYDELIRSGPTRAGPSQRGTLPRTPHPNDDDLVSKYAEANDEWGGGDGGLSAAFNHLLELELLRNKIPGHLYPRMTPEEDPYLINPGLPPVGGYYQENWYPGAGKLDRDEVWGPMGDDT